MEILPGVHRIDGIKGAHAYLLLTPQPIIVDTGLPGQETTIIKYMQGLNIAATDLDSIILTHYDLDHVGSAAALQHLTGAKVYAGTQEIPYIEGRSLRPGIKRYLPWLTAPMYGKLRPVKIDQGLEDNQVIEGIKVLATPGHTPGHICVALGQIVLVGDLLQGGMRESPRIFIWDRAMAIKSLYKLASFRPEVLLPGHGQPEFKPEAKLQQLLNRVSTK